jgi:hypothetical protein
MTLEEILRELGTDSPLNRARQEFRFASARIERTNNPIEQRRMEFEAVRKIAEILGAKT